MEHTKGANKERNQDSSVRKQDESNERSGNVHISRNTTGEGTATRLDEKSSGMSRRDRNTGLSTKDGLTGSDLDGQVS